MKKDDVKTYMVFGTIDQFTDWWAVSALFIVKLTYRNDIRRHRGNKHMNYKDTSI